MSKIELPKIIADYIASSNKKQPDDASLFFTDDAIAKDEGKTYKGVAEINEWRDTVSKAYNFNVEILDTDKKDETYLILSKLTGDFPPPNPVTITYNIKLRDGKIADLYIG